MHQTGLDGRVRERRIDRLRKAGQPVDAEEQHVGDAARLEVSQHVHPELGCGSSGGAGTDLKDRCK